MVKIGRPRGIPSYRKHKSSGQAITTLTAPGGIRKDVLLGKFNSKASRLEYARVLAEWEVSGRTVPATKDITVNEMLDRFFLFADRHYVHPDGRPTSELRDFEFSVRELVEYYGHTLAADFGPLALKAVRQRMIDAKLSRKVINQRIGRIRRAFKWAVSEELVPPSVIEGLRSVSGLDRGRSGVREADGIKPVNVSAVRAIEEHAPKAIFALCQLQLLSGARPHELLKIRGCDLTMSGKLWTYEPAQHKNSWRGQSRTIYFGKKAQAILRQFLKTDLGAYLFSPRRERNGRARIRRKKTKRTIGNHYTTLSYGKAIKAACGKAKIEPWTPLQLRHTRATEIRKKFGPEHAAALLGHTTLNTIDVYATRSNDLAKTVAGMLG